MPHSPAAGTAHACLARPGGAWALTAALLLCGALAGATLGWAEEGLQPRALMWQRQSTLEPWRCWSAAFVHFDARHLAFNVAGALLIGTLGVAAALPARAALAWALAWPLTHAALWLASAPERYAGLSGVLHAGAAVISVFLVRQAQGPSRWLGIALGLALLFKLSQEQAWLLPLQQQAGWRFPVAVVAHATGVLCGALMAALVLVVPRSRAT